MPVVPDPGVVLPNGTLMLGEVRQVLTRELVNAGRLSPGETPRDLSHLLQDRGWTEAQLDAGRIVVVRYRVYWINTMSGILHDDGQVVLAREGLQVEPGNVVELTTGASGREILRVRGRNGARGGCYYLRVPAGMAVEALGAASLVGPRGSASLYCAGIEREGWQRPRTYWHKLPGAAADSTGTAAPPSTPEHPDLATLELYRTRDNKFATTPIWIDGQQVTTLEDGQCDIVLVSPGEHVVTAGSAEGSLMSNLLPGLAPLPKRVLTFPVSAEDRLVLQYIVDTKKLDDIFGVLAGAFKSEQWAAEVYRFEMRPATDRDSCTLMHAPILLPRAGKTPPEGQQ